MPRRHRQNPELMRIWYTALDMPGGLLVQRKSRGDAINYRQQLYEARVAEEAFEGAGFDFRLYGLKVSNPFQLDEQWFLKVESSVGDVNGTITDENGDPVTLLPARQPIAFAVHKATQETIADKRIKRIDEGPPPPPPVILSKDAPAPKQSEMPWEEIIAHKDFVSLANQRISIVTDGKPHFPSIRRCVLTAGQLVAAKTHCILPRGLPEEPDIPPVPQAVQDCINARLKQFPSENN